jgi:hypothetical protein
MACICNRVARCLWRICHIVSARSSHTHTHTHTHNDLNQKGEVVARHATKACRPRGGTSLLILKFCTRWRWLTLRPGRLPLRKESWCQSKRRLPKAHLDFLETMKNVCTSRRFILWSILYLYILPSFFMSLMLHTTVLIEQTQHKHPCPTRDSNPQSQQTNDRRPMP